jgi:cell division protein FtsL
MFDSLTKREKFLVYVLMIVVIGVLFQYLLLMPALNKNSELESQLSELSSQNQLMQMAIDNSALTTTNLAKAQASLAEAKQSFTAFMHN